MHGIYVALFLIVVAVLVLSAASRKLSAVQNANYVSRTSLLTTAELHLDRSIRKICKNGILLCPKVRVADVIKPTSNNRGHFASIAQKHFDWIAINEVTSQIIAAIELDDSSHNLTHRKKRDELLNAACISAKIPLIRIRTRHEYGEDFLRNQLKLIT
jgi:hypothetical protein